MCGDKVPFNGYFSEENCTLKSDNVVLGRLCSWYSYNEMLPLRKGGCCLLSTEQWEEGKKKMVKIS